MGQQQLNCKNNAKDQGKEITTSHSNAILLMQEQSDNKTKEAQSHKQSTVRSDVEHYSPLRTSTTAHKKKNNASAPPQHQNILKISYSHFRGAVKVNNRWEQLPAKSLAEIIEGRYNSNKHFPQAQAVILLESLVYALAYLQHNSYRHHDFYPTNIHYQDGVFKVSNPLNTELSAYEFTQRRQRFSFLSPQLIAQIIEETPFSEIPQALTYKSDLFAIGMTALQFCTLEQSSQCYDEENYSLLDKQIRTRLAKTAQLYSPAIADCIAEMLKYDVDERIDPEELALAIFLEAPQQKLQREPPKEGRPVQKKLPPIPHPQRQQIPSSPPQQYLTVPGQQNQAGPQGIPLGANNIAVPTPNYAYSHIGPNNQSLLSANSLHNKLRVIQRINQTPQEYQQSEGQPSLLSNQGSQPPLPSHSHLQKIVVQQNQMPPNNPQIQHLYQQIQKQKMQPGSQQPYNNNRPPNSPPISHPQPPQTFSHPQQPPQSYSQPQTPQYLNPHPPQHVQNYGQPQPASKPMSPPLSPPINQNFFPPTSKPSSPPYSSTNTPPQASSSRQSSSSLSYEDRLLLMQPTYYEVHGKGNKEPTNDNYRPSEPTFFADRRQDSANDFALSDRYEPKGASGLPEPESYRTAQSKYGKVVPSYQPSNKYSTSSDYSPMLPQSIASKQTDQNGQTLEQRVDRILQISRSIK